MVPAARVLALLVVSALVYPSHGAQILGVFPMPVTSHQYVLTALMKGLAEKGHQVTVVTPIPQKKPINNYKEIIINNFMEKLISSHIKDNLFSMKDQSAFESTMMLFSIGNTVCESTLPDPKIQELINSNEHFDLVILEAFNIECMLGFGHTFRAPVIQISPIGGADTMGDAVGNPSPYSYVPDFTMSSNHHMDFAQRLHNTLIGMFKTIARHVYLLPKQNAFMHKYFPGPLPHVSELNARTSLMLVNNHVSISDPKPKLPTVIEVGGMHISPPKKLPQDIEKFLDEAKEGVVYFSMGSNLRSAEMPVETRDALLQAFSKLKQKVLWKWETESLPGQPKNVKLGKWFPQSDLLAHPNVKAFITHGGLLSIQEALYHGVPVIGIPIFGDQPMNMNRAVTAGYAIRLDFANITANTMTASLDAILNNPKYSETAKRLSRTFRDQPNTPLGTAVFWTEYVLRHKGAPHLRSAALDLCWYQYHLLDVLAVLAAAVLALLLAMYLLLRCLCRCVLPKKMSPTANDSKKKK